jgi:hypothetical protein
MKSLLKQKEISGRKPPVAFNRNLKSMATSTHVSGKTRLTFARPTMSSNTQPAHRLL